jgi:hypothetical protein
MTNAAWKARERQISRAVLTGRGSSSADRSRRIAVFTAGNLAEVDAKNNVAFEIRRIVIRADQRDEVEVRVFGRTNLDARPDEKALFGVRPGAFLRIDLPLHFRADIQDLIDQRVTNALADGVGRGFGSVRFLLEGEVEAGVPGRWIPRLAWFWGFQVSGSRGAEFARCANNTFHARPAEMRLWPAKTSNYRGISSEK